MQLCSYLYCCPQIICISMDFGDAFHLSVHAPGRSYMQLNNNVFQAFWPSETKIIKCFDMLVPPVRTVTMSTQEELTSHSDDTCKETNLSLMWSEYL